MSKFTKILIILIVALTIVSVPLAYVGSETTITATVTKTERIAENGGGRYLVFTDHGVFQCSDSLLFLKFRSSDIYAEIDPGETFSFRVVGWRIPFFSAYPNILEATEVVR